VGLEVLARSWRGDAALVLASAWGVALAITAVLAALGQTGPELLERHAGALAWVLVCGGVAAVAALGPIRRSTRFVAVLAAIAAPVVLVLLRVRAGGETSRLPQWVCTVSHLGVGIVPLVVGLSVLRRAAPSPARAVLCGLAAGTAGALVGEVACAQSWEHVALFHVSAWAALAVICARVSQRLQRSSLGS
jgi:hypothetical protein